ncbi:MAG TPA: ATPase/DNA packaging protein [Methanofastidiosum sp.]|nr:ATPase/DNA packaging protein [Methanofastidiosum sp.]
MFVSPKFAKKHKLNIKSSFQIIGGKLGGAKIALVDPTEGEDIPTTIDYKNVYGKYINILDNTSNIFLLFDKGNGLGKHGKRMTMVVSGPSGAGKSTFCANYMNIYRKQLKDGEQYPIYFITSITDDDRIMKIDGCTIVDLLDPEMLEYYFYNEDTKLTCTKDMFGNANLNNSLVVIDDAESLDKSIRVLLEDLISNIMKYGRHNNCNLIWSRHTINANNKLIQESLSEIMYMVLFKDCAHKRLTYFCDKYLDYGKELVNWIRKDSGCRYTIVHNRSPFFVLNDKSIMVLD